MKNHINLPDCFYFCSHFKLFMNKLSPPQVIMWTKIAIPTAWWIKIAIPTIIYLYNYIMCAEIAIHTLGVVLIP